MVIDNFTKLIKEKFFSTFDIKIRKSDIFLPFFAAVFVAANICTNIMANRLIHFRIGNFDFLIGGGIFIFALTFFILDTVTEYYGVERAYIIILTNVFALSISCFGFWFTMQLPTDGKLVPEYYYQKIIGSYYSTYFSTVCASLTGYFLNCFILNKFRYTLNGGYLVFRLLIATSIAEIIYSIVWNCVYYKESLSFDILSQLIGSNFIVKVFLEFCSIPFTIIIIKNLRKYEDVRLFTHANPFINLKEKSNELKLDKLEV